MAEVRRSDEEWRRELSPEQYAVLRQQATEPAFSGKYVHAKDDGTYVCGGCGAALFDSSTKFDSGTGWPSFTEPMVAEVVELVEDSSHGMVRTEVRCRHAASARHACSRAIADVQRHPQARCSPRKGAASPTR